MLSFHVEKPCFIQNFNPPAKILIKQVFRHHGQCRRPSQWTQQKAHPLKVWNNLYNPTLRSIILHVLCTFACFAYLAILIRVLGFRVGKAWW